MSMPAKVSRKDFKFKKKTGDVITIDGVKYVIEATRLLAKSPNPSIMLALRRPRGKKTYLAFVSKKGYISKVVDDLSW